eukprot:3240205-Rhodomonas_salina.1
MVVSEREIAKGQEIFADTPVAFCEDRLVTGGKRRCLVCGWCGAQTGTWSQRASVALGQGRKSAVMVPKTDLPSLPGLETALEEACVCSFHVSGCEEVFCTNGCASRATTSAMHGMVCSGQKGKQSPFLEFRRHARRNR